MSYYIPACVVSIGIRFDDRFHVQKEPPRPKPGSLDEFLQDSGSDPLPDYGLRPTPEPLVTGAIGDELSWFANVIPTKASIDLDGYHKASKWSVTIKWRDMPVMPVLIKAGQVRIFLGTINPSDFAAGMLEPLTRDKLTKAQLHVYDEAGQPDMDKLVIWGAFDEAEVTFNEKTNEFTIEGRDLRGIFLDSPIDEKTITTINLDQPIDKVVRDILSLHPLARNMRIQVQPSDWDTEELPHPAAKNNVTRVSKKANGKGSPSSHPPGANSKMNYWDLCVQYCQPKDALVWKADLSWAPISSIEIGDRLMGFQRRVDNSREKNCREHATAVVEKKCVRIAPVVALHMESGRIVRCTRDHYWYTGRCEEGYDFAQPKVGRNLIRVYDNPSVDFVPDDEYRLGYVRGIIAGDGTVTDRTYSYNGKPSRTKHIVLAMNDQISLARYTDFCKKLGFHPREGIRRDSKSGYTQPCASMYTQHALDMLHYAPELTSDSYMRGWLAGIFDAEGCTSHGLEIGQDKEVNAAKYEKISTRLRAFGFHFAADSTKIRIHGGRSELLRFFQLTQPAAVFKFQKKIDGGRMMGAKDRVVKIEECGEEEVVSLQTSTGTYFGQGYASKNCFLVGAVPYFHGDILIIRPVTALYKLLDAENSQDGFDPNVKTPFLNNQPRRVDGYDFSVRKLVYGRNIEQIKWKRKYLGSERPRIIEVVSLDTSADKRGKSKLITAMWPKDIAKKALAAKNKGKTPGTVTGPTGLTASEVRRIPIYGINSKEQLERIAQGIFEANARMEIVGEFSTKELASLMAAPDYGSADATEPWPNDDADLLKLRVGHPVEFLMDITNTGSRRVGDSPIVDEMQRLEGLGFDEAVEEVARRIQVTRPDGSADKDYNLARALVATARNAIVELQSIYRVNKVKFNYDNGKIQISGSVHNYIEVEYGDNSRKTERKPRKIQKQSVAQAGPTSMELDKKYAQERAAYKAELERQNNPSLDDIIERYKKR